MSISVTRRTILFAAGSSSVVLPILSQTNNAQTPARPPALDAALVKEFVIAGHGNLERTKELLEKEKGLLNATWDWGGGDFETALGGASHMGRRDIALFLLDQGSRMDLFAAAMLGQTEIVKTALAAFPKAQSSLGPHRIPLIEHARKGGAEAAGTLRLLESLQGQSVS
jgi:hypothetical protein